MWFTEYSRPRLAGLARLAASGGVLAAKRRCAAIAAGADGLMIETHHDPSKALVDAQQMITPDELKEVIESCKHIHRVTR